MSSVQSRPNRVNPDTLVVENVQDLYLRSMLAAIQLQIGDVTQLATGDIVTSSMQAATDAANALTLANAAQTSANGKNTIFYADTAHIPTANAVGDTWFVTAVQTIGGVSTTVIVDQRTWTGSAWASQPLTSAVFAYIDAGKITTGTLSAINLVGNFIETQANVGTGSSPSVVRGSLMNASGQIFSYSNTGLFFGVDPTIGNVTVIGGTFTSPTITGGVIRTAASGTRVELNSSLVGEVAFYYSTGSLPAGTIIVNSSGIALSGVTSISGASSSMDFNADTLASIKSIDMTGLGGIYNPGTINGFVLTGAVTAGGNDITGVGTFSATTISGVSTLTATAINGFALNGSMTFNGSNRSIGESGTVANFASGVTVPGGATNPLKLTTLQGFSSVIAAQFDSSTQELGKSSSSERYKVDVRDMKLDEAERLAMAYRPRWFKWNPDTLDDDPDPAEEHLGLIAEEVFLNVHHDLVAVYQDAIDGVDYARSMLPFAPLIQQLWRERADTADLRSRVEALEAAK